MHSTKTDDQHWSIRAEFTVSPQGVCVPEKKCLTNTIQDKSGIRLSYCWQSNENTNVVNTSNFRPVRNLCKPVEYQKGNLTFTSTPPCRLHTTTCGNNFEYQDSGYGSDLLSINSAASRSPQSPNDPNNRKCRSTCSIVLCSNVCNNTEENSTLSRQIKYEKSDSLSCQTPAIQNRRHNTNLSDRGDLCCQHINSAKNKKLSDQVICSARSQYPTSLVSPIKDKIIESTECKPYKKDVSIQTSDSLHKCSVTNFESSQKARKSEDTHLNNRNPYKRGQHSSDTRDSGKKLQTSSSGKLNFTKNWEKVGHTNDSSKKSRTIHIDVYCTDTDMELSETSSDSWENESTSTPQTVFESQSVSVTHERARDNGLPFRIKRRSRKKTSNLTKSVEMEDSDIDGESTTSYPSKIDSYSTINDFSSSISSIKSWKSHSLLSCTNEHDSVKHFDRAGTLPMVGKPLLHKLNIERKCITGDTCTKNILNERNVYTSNHEKIGDKLQNICSKQNEWQNYGRLQQQTPFGKALILNTNLVNSNIEENAMNNNNEKYLEVPENAVSLRKSSESNVGETFHEKLIVDTTSRPVLEILPRQYTEQIASRFGQVINIFKKPGRHKGPTKNPDCCCDYCRRYFM